MKIEDDWTAFQLDSALAVRGSMKDETILTHRSNVSNWHILQVCKSLGAKKIPKYPPKMPNLNPKNKSKGVPILSDLMKEMGGTGTVLVKRNKND